MRILMLHAFYQQLGGEDLSFRAEAALLRSHGETVETFTVDNEEVEGWSAVQKGVRLLWHTQANERLSQVMGTFKPDILHVQNTFPGLSPSIFHVAARHGVPVVQKLSNYRMFCVNGTFFRDGKPCESCLGKHLAWRGAVHGCYRGSRTMSAALAAATGLHWAAGTWTHRIHAYVALDEDGRQRFLQAGLPAAKLHVKPNFLDPFPAPGSGSGGYALFAGRLSEEKGAATMIRAWKQDPALPDLMVAGSGPLMARLRVEADLDPRIKFLGQVPGPQLQSLMAEAALVVVPSEFREPFGRVALEALGVGTPVLSSRSGALQHIIRPGVNGAHFDTGDAASLRSAAARLLAHPETLYQLRASARRDAMERFSGEANYRILLRIYAAARREAGLGAVPGQTAASERAPASVRAPEGRTRRTGTTARPPRATEPGTARAPISSPAHDRTSTSAPASTGQT